MNGWRDAQLSRNDSGTHATTAVVFSESTGRYGVTWNEPNKKEAIEVATDYCRKMGGGKDCKPLRVTDELGFGAVANTCAGNFCGISVITGRRSAAQAERDAIKDCNSYYGTNNCVVLDNWQETGAAPVAKAPPNSQKPQQKPALAENKSANKPNAPIKSDSRTSTQDNAFLAIAVGHQRWGDDGLPIIGKGEQASIFYCGYSDLNGDLKKCVENKCKKVFPGEGKCKMTDIFNDRFKCEYDGPYIMAYVGPPGDNEQILSQANCKKSQRDAYVTIAKNGFPVEKGRRVLDLIYNRFKGIHDMSHWIEDKGDYIIDVIQAENENASHQFYLALYYENHARFNDKALIVGDSSVVRLINGDRDTLKLAEEWLLKAAINGHPDAQFILGSRMIDSKSEKEKGIAWLVKAAVQGHKGAQDFKEVQERLKLIK